MGEHLTPAQRDELLAELAELEGPRRKEIVEAIAVARGHGDLSENFEYHAAKNEQGLLERKITILRARLEDAEIVEGGDPDVVAVGSHVVIEDDAGSRLEVEISGLGGPGKTSPSSPLGAGADRRAASARRSRSPRPRAPGRRRSSRSARPQPASRSDGAADRAGRRLGRRRQRPDTISDDQDGHALGGQGVLEIGVLVVVEAEPAVPAEDVGAPSVEHERSDGWGPGPLPLDEYRPPLDRGIPHPGGVRARPRIRPCADPSRRRAPRR